MKCRYVYEDKYRYAKYYFKIINTLENIQMFKRMTGRKRYLNVDEVKRKTFKKSTTTFDKFMHHLLLILLYFLFSIPSFSFSKLPNSIFPWHLSSFVEWRFYLPFYAWWFISEVDSNNFSYILSVHLYFFCNCSWKIKLRHTQTSTVKNQAMLQNLIQRPGS